MRVTKRQTKNLDTCQFMDIDGRVETARKVVFLSGEAYWRVTTKGRKFITDDEKLGKILVDNVGIYGRFTYGHFELGGMQGVPNTYYLKNWIKT